MKGWIMIHKVKALYDNGNGLSVRKIAQKLQISRNTVSKYINMEESEIERRQSKRERDKKLDEYRSYIIHLLQSYPDLSAVKILRKLKAKVELLDISDRSVRRYIESLKVEISVKQGRYYEPVIDMVGGAMSGRWWRDAWSNGWMQRDNRIFHSVCIVVFKADVCIVIIKANRYADVDLPTRCSV